MTVLSSQNKVIRRFMASETKDPDIGVRRQAYNLAKELYENRDGEYHPPLVKAAKAYYDSLDKTSTESERARLAADLMETVDDHIKAAEATVRILTRYQKVFDSVKKDHDRLK